MGLFNLFNKEQKAETDDLKNLNDEQTQAGDSDLDVPEEAIHEDETSEEAIREEEASNEETEEKEEQPEQKIGFFKRMKAGLSKTRENILNGVEQVLKGFKSIDEEFYEELEEALIMADIGVETSMKIIDDVRERVKKEKIKEVPEVRQLIIEVITEILEKDDEPFKLEHPAVLLIVGVNGAGKTTTIGKLANLLKSQNKKILLAAADTFRAAAIDQLEVWGKRNNVDVIKHQENSDPGAVVYDAVKAAKARNIDVLICDTAGRLHNKKNLMEELKKISKIISREYQEAQIETLLVLDATTGQNALQQAKIFKEAADITGIVLTKLDGTAKGGIVIAIKNELKIPVRYIGVGEKLEDLQPFNASEFSKALFGTDD